MGSQSETDYPGDIYGALPWTAAAHSSKTSFRDLDDCYCATAFETDQRSDKVLASSNSGQPEGEYSRVVTWIEATAVALAAHPASTRQLLNYKDDLVGWHALDRVATPPPSPASLEDQQAFPYAPTSAIHIFISTALC